MRYLIGRCWLALFGWRLVGLQPLPRGTVMIAAPHTSNWDLVFMIAAAWVLRARISWLGKDAIFRNPIFRPFMTWLGGIPIDRSTRGETVRRIAERFREIPSLILAVPVEGTRGKTEYWKSGFYHIARTAGVPIGLGFLDYAKRHCGVARILELTGNVRTDMDRIREFYRGVTGKYPELHGTPRLREEEDETGEART